MSKQTTKIIFSSDRESRTVEDNLAFQELTRNFLGHLFDRGLIEGFGEAEGVYTYKEGLTCKEKSFVCILNFAKEEQAKRVLLRYAFNDVKQESVLLVDYNNNSSLIFGHSEESRTENIGKLTNITGQTLPENYTRLSNGQIFAVVK